MSTEEDVVGCPLSSDFRAWVSKSSGQWGLEKLEDGAWVSFAGGVIADDDEELVAAAEKMVVQIPLEGLKVALGFQRAMAVKP